MAVITKATLSTVSGVTTIAGTAAQIITAHSNGGGTLSLGTDFVAIVTGATTAADLTAIAAATSGTVTASGVTTITGTAAEVVAAHDNSELSSIDTDFLVTVSGTATAVDLTSINTATSGAINASGVTAITGTAAQIEALIINANVTLADNVSVMLSDTVVAASVLNTIDGNTSGAINAATVTTVTGTDVAVATAYASAGITDLGDESVTVTGTASNDILNVLTNTDSVQAGAGTDTIVFAGNYADYTFSQTDSYLSVMTHNTTGQAVSLYGAEELQFDDTTAYVVTTASGEFQVNTVTTHAQSNPNIITLSDGSFVVTWNSHAQDGDGDGIYGQRYDANGSVNGDEFKVNTYTDNYQFEPSATALSDGGFVITWTSTVQDGSGAGIYAQRYHASGSVNGDEFKVNTVTDNYQSGTSVTTLGDGGFVVTWSSYEQDGSSYGVYAQRYDANGGANGTEFQVNTYATSNQQNPSTATLSDGGFVVTWQSDGQDGSNYGIYGQRYDANGAANGTEFQVNAYTASYQQNPSTTALSDGGFVVTWTSYEQDGSGNGIYGQRYDANGAANGTEFQVNTYTDNFQYSPNTTALSDGGFVVTWSSYDQDGSYGGIYAQRYDANGDTNGTEFQVNTYSTDAQESPSTTALSDGGFVVTWQSFDQDGSNNGIYAQRYDAQGEAFIESVLIARAPTVSVEIVDGVVLEDVAYNYSAAANFSDADSGDTLTYSATLSDGLSLPSWLSINATTGVLSGTPDNADVRVIAVKVTATDVANTSVSDTYTLTVSNTNDAAIITVADANITEDVATVTGTATHTDVDANNAANVFTPVSTTSSTYGSYSVSTAGDWAYTLDNSNTTIQALSLGESTTDSITVTAEDGTIEAITITINGANDAAKLLSSYSTSPANVIDNLTIELWKENTQVGGDLAITKGEVIVDSTTDFDQVRISQSDAFDTSSAINVFDVLLTVENIVGLTPLTGSAKQAADVNNDSNVNVFDVLAMVEHIVGVSSIDHFDMVDSGGERITQLASITSGDVPEYYLVMNGDVNMDGAFNEGYVTTLDIV